MMQLNEEKLNPKCQCGCGQNVKIAKRTYGHAKIKKGEYYKYIKGHHYKTPFEERFWKYVEKTENCWNWKGFKDKDGYGIFRIVPERQHRATHVAWLIKHKSLPTKNICHKCDNPSCIRIDHLFECSSKENSEDRNNKGRQARGEKGGTAKLTEQDVLEIRRMYTDGKSSCQIHEIYQQVCYSTVKRIISRKIWKHI